MQIEQVGVPSSFKEAGPGALIYFRLHGETHVGLKTFEERASETAFGCVALARPGIAGRPEIARGRPSHFVASVVDSYPVLVIPDARFLFPFGHEDWCPARNVELHPGDVLVSRDRTLLLASSGDDDPLLVDLSTGEVIRGRNPDLNAAMLVRRWSVVWLHFGKPKTLFEFPPKTSQGAGPV
jgi:hypothetical protein